MAMRISGLMSGMDTESIISQLVEAKRTKVNKTVKAQKSLKYKQDAWKTLNSQIKKLHSNVLSNMRFEFSYAKKTTKVSNSSAVSVITGANAMNGVQSLKVKELAQTGYLTGDKMSRTDQKKVTGDTTLAELGYDVSGSGVILVEGMKDGEQSRVPITVDGSTTVRSFVSALQTAGLSANFDETNGRIYVGSKVSGAENDFTIRTYRPKDGYESGIQGAENGLKALDALGLRYTDSDETERLNTFFTNAIKNGVWDDIKNLEGAGATPDATNNNKYITSNLDAAIQAKLDAIAAGGENTLTNDEYKKIMEVITSADNTYNDSRLNNWASDWQANQSSGGAIKTDGKDAVINLNGVDYSSSKNTFEINGLTLTVNAKTAENEVITITTEDDTQGIYDMVKNFLKEYNSLINQMDKLYNAPSNKEYEPLLDEEKQAMSDSEVEEWENKIKESILRKDSSLSTIASEMKRIMMEGVVMSVNENTDPPTENKMYLSNFGINTLGYFLAPENEKNAYHIDGDSDDGETSGNPDKLKSMIANDPDTVIKFFTQLSKNLYDRMTEVMKHTDYSSAYTAYDDIKMQEEYDDYTVKIKDLENKLADYEDKWYAKFAAMETAMAKMQQNASAVTALLGGGM